MDCSEKTRRPMSQALQPVRVNDAARAFVNGGAVKTVTTPIPVVAPPPPVAGSSGAAPVSFDARLQNPNGVPTASGPAAPSPAGLPVVSASVSMTFRLPAPLSAQLVRVSTERKLRRQEPFTQLDIVVEALTAWLRNCG